MEQRSVGLNEGSTIVGAIRQAGSVAGPTEAVKAGSRTNAETGLADGFPQAGPLAMTLRSRTVVIEPGGVLPVDGGKGCPTFVRVVQGTVDYHNSGEQRRFDAGHVVLESGAAAHWWTSDGIETATLQAIDACETSSGP